ncbi:hypothetical protein KC19_VG147700 [Ceratodon purpureus]|uniref:Uncharacterized protein n=1 Tax=Ceratodon purpureus TaxID=3225 RepID=A0A8T0HQL7_CERPU|nr:hypothetical protein KC19_VG147700 [Ceratodon purpureus]
MAMVLIALNVCFIEFSESLNVFLSSCIGGMCVVPRAPAVIIMMGSTFQPWFLMSLIRGRYFIMFLPIVSGENLSFV